MRIFIIATALTLSLTGAGMAHGPHSDVIERVYFKYLGRLPDADGYSFWGRKLNYHSTLEFEATVLGSKEYFDRKCAGCQRTFVRALYRDVQNNWDPCPREVERWMSRLAQCGCRQRLATEFLTACAAASQPVVVPQPVVVRPQPVHVHSEPVVLQQPVVVRQPVVVQQPVVVRPQPVHVHTEPVIVHPEPVFVRPPVHQHGYTPGRSYRDRLVPGPAPRSDNLHLHIRF